MTLSPMASSLGPWFGKRFLASAISCPNPDENKIKAPAVAAKMNIK
jgi:hypothetical protein